MPKKNRVYVLEVYEDNLLVNSSTFPTYKAEDLFVYYVELAVKMRFNNINRFRLVSGTHILFDFQDVRKMVDQKSLLLL